MMDELAKALNEDRNRISLTRTAQEERATLLLSASHARIRLFEDGHNPLSPYGRSSKTPSSGAKRTRGKAFRIPLNLLVRLKCV